mmetsp:Transcript_26320/g.81306  ORF Transcript_26320/g.81306 Transcript_26320/m.81306 type:complete len:295 (-) Transcript_26320:563-1447(-)
MMCRRLSANVVRRPCRGARSVAERTLAGFNSRKEGMNGAGGIRGASPPASPGTGDGAGMMVEPRAAKKRSIARIDHAKKRRVMKAESGGGAAPAPAGRRKGRKESKEGQMCARVSAGSGGVHGRERVWRGIGVRTSLTTRHSHDVETRKHEQILLPTYAWRGRDHKPCAHGRDHTRVAPQCHTANETACLLGVVESGRRQLHSGWASGGDARLRRAQRAASRRRVVRRVGPAGAGAAFVLLRGKRRGGGRGAGRRWLLPRPRCGALVLVLLMLLVVLVVVVVDKVVCCWMRHTA